MIACAYSMDTKTVRCVCMGDDGRWALLAVDKRQKDTAIRLWDETGKCVRLPGHGDG